MTDQRSDWEANTEDHVNPRMQHRDWRLEEERRTVGPGQEEMLIKVLRYEEREKRKAS